MDEKIEDIIIIGGGGAGLTAALYCSRANLSTLLFEKLMPGGQISVTDMVENYPGFPEGILGPEIAQKMEAQAKRYNAKIKYEEVTSVLKEKDVFKISSSGGVYWSKAVILAMGASYKMLNVLNEKKLIGKGVSYCATCDGAFFKEKEVVVVGGGDSALQEGLFLTNFAKKVTIIHRRDQLRASSILQERAKAHDRIDFIWDTVIEKIEGEEKVEKTMLKNVKTENVVSFKTDGIFIFIGHSPNTSLVKELVKLDKNTSIITDELTYQTSVPGIFAAGELRKGAVRQLVAACGEGCAAALSAQSYLEGLK